MLDLSLKDSFPTALIAPAGERLVAIWASESFVTARRRAAWARGRAQDDAVPAGSTPYGGKICVDLGRHLRFLPS